MTSGVVLDPQAGLIPDWSSVLAVVAHPDDESFGLGAVLDTFTGDGSVVSLLCLTHGEASTVHGITGHLDTVRAQELQAAAEILSVGPAVLRDYPDGALASVPRQTLVTEVVRAVQDTEAAGLLVFDPSGVTGHPDHVAATMAALEAAMHSSYPSSAGPCPMRSPPSSTTSSAPVSPDTTGPG